MHARLVENDMREFRQPVLDVLNPSAADDVFSLAVVRLPERRFSDPARLLQHAFAEAIGMKHLHGAAGDAVGLAEQQPARLLLDDAGLDVGKCRKLRRQRQAGRSAADDQHVDFSRNRSGCAGSQNPLGGIGDFGIARLEAVQVKLHETCSSRSRHFGYCSVC